MPAAPLVFVPLPMENPRNTVAHSQALAAYLGQLSGRRVEIRHFSDYDEILRAFAADQIDLLHLGPLPLLQLKQMTTHAVSMVAFRESDGQSRYTCTLASATDVRLEQGAPGTLQPMRLALTQPMSTCGRLASAWLLQQAGGRIDAANSSYLGSHEAVALALVRGEYALGGLKRAIADRYRQLGVRVVAETDPLPGFVLVANGRTMTTQQIEALREGLLRANADVLSRLELGRHGFAPVDGRLVSTVERMVRDTGFQLTAGPGR